MKKCKPGKLIASFVLFTALFSFVSFGAEGLIYFSDPVTEVNNTVEVTMTVQSDDTSVEDVNVLLKYPSSSLEFKKGTSANGGAGTIRVHGKGTAEGSNKMNYVLSFKTLSAGEFTVNIDSCEVYDASGAAITMSHLGSSKITVAGDAALNSDLSLSSLEVSPGTLTPAFSPDVNSYSVTVGTSVDRLTINALPADTQVSVSVVNNDSLKDGENDVIIYLKSADGQSQNEYHINVLKTEGGEENLQASEAVPSEVESVGGVQLSCKAKTITIIDPEEGVTAPEGFRESQIRIDGQPVRGWITGEDSQPEYFLVYGMNDDGELHFYRYDRVEKSIQRYFENTENFDPLDTDEYKNLQSELEKANSDAETRKLILCILAILILLMLGILIYLAVRLSVVSRELVSCQEDRMTGQSQRRLDPEKSSRTRSRRESDRRVKYAETDPEDVQDDDSYEYDDDDVEEPENDNNATDATIVRSPLRSSHQEKRSEGRRRTSRRAERFEETTVIRRSSRRSGDSDSDLKGF